MMTRLMTLGTLSLVIVGLIGCAEVESTTTTDVASATVDREVAIPRSEPELENPNSGGSAAMQTSFEAARVRAEKEGKKILVSWTANPCESCTELESNFEHLR